MRLLKHLITIFRLEFVRMNPFRVPASLNPKPTVVSLSKRNTSLIFPANESELILLMICTPRDVTSVNVDIDHGSVQHHEPPPAPLSGELGAAGQLTPPAVLPPAIALHYLIRKQSDKNRIMLRSERAGVHFVFWAGNCPFVRF